MLVIELSLDPELDCDGIGIIPILGDVKIGSRYDFFGFPWALYKNVSQSALGIFLSRAPYVGKCV